MATPIDRPGRNAASTSAAPSNLSIHAVLGPWISLRAVIVADVEPVDEPPPPLPCAACPRACVPAFERARDQTDWRTWLAVRDACPIGREHRFQEDHLRYGYTKDRDILRRAITESAAEDP